MPHNRTSPEHAPEQSEQAQEPRAARLKDIRAQESGYRADDAPGSANASTLALLQSLGRTAEHIQTEPKGWSRWFRSKDVKTWETAREQLLEETRNDRQTLSAHVPTVNKASLSSELDSRKKAELCEAILRGDHDIELSRGYGAGLRLVTLALMGFDSAWFRLHLQDRNRQGNPIGEEELSQAYMLARDGMLAIQTIQQKAETPHLAGLNDQLRSLCVFIENHSDDVRKRMRKEGFTLIEFVS